MWTTPFKGHSDKLESDKRIMKPTRANLCSSIRAAIVALQCSPNRALNIINSEAGNMEVKSRGEDKTGDFKAKLFKSPDKVNKAQVTVRPGSIQYRSVLTIALLFAAYNDLNAQAEKLNPKHTVTIQPDSQFGLWLKEKCAKPADENPEEVNQVTA